MPFPLAFQAAPGAVYRATAGALGGVPVRGQPQLGNIGGLPKPAVAAAGKVLGKREALEQALLQKKQMQAEGEAMARQHAEQMGLPLLKQPPQAVQLPAQPMLPQGPPPAQAIPQGPPPIDPGINYGPKPTPSMSGSMPPPMQRPGFGGGFTPPQGPSAPMPQGGWPQKPPRLGGMVNGKLPIRTAPAGQMMNGGTPFRYRVSRG